MTSFLSDAAKDVEDFRCSELCAFSGFQAHLGTDKFHHTFQCCILQDLRYCRMNASSLALANILALARLIPAIRAMNTTRSTGKCASQRSATSAEVFARPSTHHPIIGTRVATELIFDGLGKQEEHNAFSPQLNNKLACRHQEATMFRRPQTANERLHLQIKVAMCSAFSSKCVWKSGSAISLPIRIRSPVTVPRHLRSPCLEGLNSFDGFDGYGC